MMESSLLRTRPHPLPTSPIKGEVWAGGFEQTVPFTQIGTSPLVGEAGRGVSP